MSRDADRQRQRQRQRHRQRHRRAVFKKVVRESLPARFTLETDLPPERDHPVTFPQADYLKILLWRAAQA